jgi:hypothetical protein
VGIEVCLERSDEAMSKSAVTVESLPKRAMSRSKRARKAQLHAEASAQALAPAAAPSTPFPTKPLMIGIGIGAALTLTAMKITSRPVRSSYFAATPATVAGALTKTAAVFLARFVVRKALVAAANQGARKLAFAWT